VLTQVTARLFHEDGCTQPWFFQGGILSVTVHCQEFNSPTPFGHPQSGFLLVKRLGSFDVLPACPTRLPCRCSAFTA
jgi:hypothetical protein